MGYDHINTFQFFFLFNIIISIFGSDVFSVIKALRSKFKNHTAIIILLHSQLCVFKSKGLIRS